MAGRPPKSIKVLQMEGKSHLTKKEKATRTRAEESGVTGQKIREDRQVREDPTAHQEFLRVIKLLRALEKDDSLYSAEINLYCRLKSELDAEEQDRNMMRSRLEDLGERAKELQKFEDIMAMEKIMDSIRSKIGACERRIEAKRKMRIQIEDKNLMNIISSLRSVPKTADKKKSPLAEALGG